MAGFAYVLKISAVFLGSLAICLKIAQRKLLEMIIEDTKLRKKPAT